MLDSDEMYIVPAVPVLFGHVYLAYEKSRANSGSVRLAPSQYPCYNYHVLHLPIDNQSLLFFNDIACGSPPGLYYSSFSLKQPSYPLPGFIHQFRVIVKYE
jgi:hypothetical protein